MIVILLVEKIKALKICFGRTQHPRIQSAYFGGIFACEMCVLKDLLSSADKGPTKKKESRCLGRQDDGAEGHELTSYYENKERQYSRQIHHFLNID